MTVTALKSATCGQGLLHPFILLPESFGGLVTAASLQGTWEGSVITPQLDHRLTSITVRVFVHI